METRKYLSINTLEKQHQQNRLCVNQSTLCLSHSALLFPIYIYKSSSRNIYFHFKNVISFFGFFY